MRTPDDLQAFLDAHEIPGEIIRLTVPTPTVQAAADALGVSPNQIIKSVLFLTPTAPVIALGYGLNHIDKRAVTTFLGIGRKRAKLADSEKVLALTGYPAGAVPPFGYPQPIRTLIDPVILTHEVIYAGGGGGSAMMRLDPALLPGITKGAMLSLMKEPKHD
jgi:prolyl-tRNA editing enzyme YbaK/EbsC (Cys-tRNA(Pro) deacylase)